MSPEPFVSCAQAPPAKGRDGLWGREWRTHNCGMDEKGLGRDEEKIFEPSVSPATE